MNKRVTIGAVVLSTVVALTLGAVSASAHFFPDDTEMTKTLAQKLGVSEDKVKDAFASMRSEHQATMKAELEKSLSQAVTDGKITEAQKQAILKKFGEMKDQKMDPQTFKNMSKEERQAERQNKKAELEAWAKENNLDLATLNELLGHGKGMGWKGGHMMGPSEPAQ